MSRLTEPSHRPRPRAYLDQQYWIGWVDLRPRLPMQLYSVSHSRITAMDTVTYLLISEKSVSSASRLSISLSQYWSKSRFSPRRGRGPLLDLPSISFGFLSSRCL